MRVDIWGHVVGINRAMREHIERRFQFALGRFAERLVRVRVYLADVNGPRGGRDKRCRVVADLESSGSVVIEDLDADLIAVVDRAADRAGHAVGRELERRRDARRGPSASGEPT